MPIQLTALNDEEQESSSRSLGQAASGDPKIKNLGRLNIDESTLKDSINSFSEICEALVEESKKKSLKLDEISCQLQISTKGKVGIVICSTEVKIGASFNMKFKVQGK